MITAYSGIFVDKLNRLELRLARMSDDKSAETAETIVLREMLEAEAGRLRRVLDALDSDDRTDLAA